MKRRNLLQRLATLAPAALAAPVWAQDAFPSRPVRIVCGSTPGALLDVASRLYADRMARHLQQPVVVENVAGASSLIAARTVAKAEPNGYTLLSAANTVATVPHLSKKAGYAMSDFSAIGEMARSPSVMVTSAASPFKTLADLVEAAKRQPGGLSYASGGQGTTSHLPAELFLQQSGLKITHVPYKGVAQAVPDVASDRVAFLMATPTSVAGLVQAGQLRVLAITSDARSPKFPQVPTFKELGYGEASYEVWVGLFAPANLPRAVRARLGEAVEAARNDAVLASKLEEMGQTISGVRTPEQFDAFLRSEDAKVARLVKETGLVAE
jgi:tripartite-type tricarboxylate transporter receptor subunit TctC